MKQLKDFDKAKKAAEQKGSAQLPVGAYICSVKNVQYVEGQDGSADKINLLFDVCEGEHKDFFKKQYDENTADDKKWKGRTTIWIPEDTDEDWKQQAFARWTVAFEESNKGYIWDWDENKWKNKKIGLVYGPTGTVIDGKEIVYNEVHGCCSVAEVKSGKFYQKNLELRKKNGYTGNGSANQATTSSTDFVSIPDGVEEEIPF